MVKRQYYYIASVAMKPESQLSYGSDAATRSAMSSLRKKVPTVAFFVSSAAQQIGPAQPITRVLSFARSVVSI
jgi:hypothetical protein